MTRALASVRLRLGQEDGIALPVAVTMLFLTLTLGGVAVYQAASASDGTIRDTEVKRAVQAADAGLEVAVGRMAITWEPPCALSEPGWCPPVEEVLGDGERYSYTIYDDLDPDTPHRVVSTGLAAGQTRRVTLEVHPPTPGASAFDVYAVRSLETLRLNSNAGVGSPEIAGHAASNGDIILDSNAFICGNATPGPGRIVDLRGSSEICPGYSTAPAAEPFTLPPGTAPAEDDNDRICVAALDPCTDQGSISWNAGTRRLTLDSNSTLTLTGSVYTFCQLHLRSNSRLIVASGADVKIFILPPEQCTGEPPNQVDLDSNSKIINGNADPATLQLFMAGSASQATSVNIDSNFANDCGDLSSEECVELPMLLYAPRSSITLNSNVRIVGAVAAKSVSLDSNAAIHYADDAQSVFVPGTETDLERLQFVECTTEPLDPEDPGSGC